MAAKRNDATHVRIFPRGRIEFRPGRNGGWASRAVFGGKADNWIYFGPELPNDAVQIRGGR